MSRRGFLLRLVLLTIYRSFVGYKCVHCRSRCVAQVTMDEGRHNRLGARLIDSVRVNGLVQ